MLARLNSSLRMLVPSAILSVALIGCAAPATGSDSQGQDEAAARASAQLNGDLTEEEAVAAARASVSFADGKEVWATMAGPYAAVFDAMAHQPDPDEQPAVDTPLREVWGVQFRVKVELCGPWTEENSCEIRDALRTVFLDPHSGTWIRTSTYAPAPGDPLPKPTSIEAH